MKIKNKLSLVLVATAMAFLPACSTIVNGTGQSIDFDTGEVTEANCLITGGENGTVNEKFVSPATLSIPRSKKVINIGCNKEGYQDASIIVDSKYEASTAGNVVAGGFIGLGVDAMTGALYKYPGTITIPMVALDSAMDHTEE